MRYAHKVFTNSFSCKGILSRKFKFLSERYNGKGRPKNSDYDFKSMIELQDEQNKLMSKKLDEWVK